MRRWQVTAAAAVLALGVTLASSSSAVAISGTLAIGSASTFPGPGGEVAVGLVVEVGDPGLGAWTIEIAYDAEILSVFGCLGTKGSICLPAFGVDTVRVTGASASGLDSLDTLAIIVFTCEALGVSPLALTASVFADATLGNPQDIDVTIADGVITCEGSDPMGDANCSGTVDAIDALVVLQYSAGLIAFPTCPQYSDVDGNGEIDAIDAVFILQFVAGLIDDLPFDP